MSTSRSGTKLSRIEEWDPVADSEATKEVVREVRKYPELCRAVGVPDTADDRTLVLALSKHEAPFDALRTAGCGLAPATKVVRLLPAAVRQPPLSAKAQQKEAFKIRWLWVCAGFGLVAIIGLCVLLIQTIIGSTAGWYLGSCTISAFSNQTCMQGNGCNIDVMVRGSGRFMTYIGWTIPTKLSSDNGVQVNRFVGDGFICCGGPQQLVLGCCNLYDTTLQVFCDKWAAKTSPEGLPCPSQPWKCLYKFHLDQGVAFVDELQVYQAPVIWPYAAGIGFIAMVVVLACVFNWVSGKLKALAKKSMERSSSRSSVSSENTEGTLGWLHDGTGSQSLGLGEMDGDLQEQDEPDEEAPKEQQAEDEEAKVIRRRIEEEEQEAGLSLAMKRKKNADEETVHPALRGGDLSAWARDTSHLIQPIIEPLPKRPGTTNARTLMTPGGLRGAAQTWGGPSSMQSSKGFGRGARRGPGGKRGMAATANATQWAWARGMQDDKVTIGGAPLKDFLKRPHLEGHPPALRGVAEMMEEECGLRPATAPVVGLGGSRGGKRARVAPSSVEKGHR